MFFQSLNKYLGLIVGFLLVSMVFSGLIFPIEAEQPKPVWVDKNKNWVYDSGEPTFDTIQDAINAASQYDWIGVNATLYNPNGNKVENVIVNKTGLYIKSINGRALVNATGLNSSVFRVEVNHTKIEGFNITGGTNGIYVYQANNCTLTGNKAYNNTECGINVYFLSTDCSLVRNQAYNNEIGIGMVLSSNCSLVGNQAYNNDYGIVMGWSANCSLVKNKVYSSFHYGIWLSGAINCSLVENQAYNTLVGIWLNGSFICSLVKNEVYNNLFGIGVEESVGCSLVRNQAYNNEAGIGVVNSIGCMVLNNFIANNTIHGIWLEYSNQTYIVGNTIINNTGVHPLSGIHIDSESTENKIYYNNILDNTNLTVGSYGVYDEDFPATIATYNWWGHPSGPYNETTNPSGLGDAVNEWVEYRPWLNESVTKAKYTIASNTGTLDALDEADVTIHFDTTEPVEIYVANYTGNPVAELGVPGLNRYIDLFINQTDGVNQLEIRLYYTDEQIADLGLIEESLFFYWWNGTSWIECSHTGVNITGNYVWAIVTQTTMPSIQNLTGTIFAPVGKLASPPPPPEKPPKPPVGGKVIPVNPIETLTSWITTILLLLTTTIIILTKTKKHQLILHLKSSKHHTNNNHKNSPSTKLKPSRLSKKFSCWISTPSPFKLKTTCTRNTLQ